MIKQIKLYMFILVFIVTNFCVHFASVRINYDESVKLHEFTNQLKSDRDGLLNFVVKAAQRICVKLM